MRGKVTVVGAGAVGATTAQYVAQRGYADVVLLDIVPNMPQGMSGVRAHPNRPVM